MDKTQYLIERINRIDTRKDTSTYVVWGCMSRHTDGIVKVKRYISRSVLLRKKESSKA